MERALGGRGGGLAHVVVISPIKFCEMCEVSPWRECRSPSIPNMTICSRTRAG